MKKCKKRLDTELDRIIPPLKEEVLNYPIKVGGKTLATDACNGAKAEFICGDVINNGEGEVFSKEDK